MVKFQHNNHIYISTQQIPFLLNTRYIPYIDFESRQWLSGLETVNKFMEQIKVAVKKTKSIIQKM